MINDIRNQRRMERQSRVSCLKLQSTNFRFEIIFPRKRKRERKKNRLNRLKNRASQKMLSLLPSLRYQRTSIMSNTVMAVLSPFRDEQI